MLPHVLPQKEYDVVFPSFSATTGIKRVDKFIGDFTSSKIYLLQGYFPMINKINSLLSVNVVKNFGTNVVFIDGGNSIDLYGISDISRLNSSNTNLVLSRIMVARAFTAYQLDSLIFNIKEYIKEFHPILLIINCITDLLFDKDIRNEGEELLEKWLCEIKKQTEANNIISIVTTRRCNTLFSDFLELTVDNSARFEKQKKCVKISLANRGKSMIYLPVPWYQKTLDEFMEIENGENIAYI